MRPIERKAAFKSAATLREITMGEGAQELGVSYNHLMQVIDGQRIGSKRLCEAFATFIGRPVDDVFGPRRISGGIHGSHRGER